MDSAPLSAEGCRLADLESRRFAGRERPQSEDRSGGVRIQRSARQAVRTIDTLREKQSEAA